MLPMSDVMRLRVIWMAPICMVLWSSAAFCADAPPDSTTASGRARGAVLRSMTLPGWGQFYNRKRIKGSVIAALEVGSMAAYVVRRKQLRDRGLSERNAFLFSTIGIILYSMADAYVDAHLDRVDWAEVEAGLDGEGKAQLRLKVRWR